MLASAVAHILLLAFFVKLIVEGTGEGANKARKQVPRCLNRGKWQTGRLMHSCAVLISHTSGPAARSACRVATARILRPQEARGSQGKP